MTIHKLTAGSGYDYLTRQVAAQDATERGHSGLASYYSAKGETPGVWVGRGLSGFEGLSAGDAVTEEQMRNLFGSGRHPLAERLRATAADAPVLTTDPPFRRRASAEHVPPPATTDRSQERRPRLSSLLLPHTPLALTVVDGSTLNRRGRKSA